MCNCRADSAECCPNRQARIEKAIDQTRFLGRIHAMPQQPRPRPRPTDFAGSRTAFGEQSRNCPEFARGPPSDVRRERNRGPLPLPVRRAASRCSNAEDRCPPFPNIKAAGPAQKTWIHRKVLTASLLLNLKQKELCSDLVDISVYDRGDGRWAIGHVRLGPSRQYCRTTLSAVQSQFAKVFLLIPA